jgi:hypothetical protein
MKIRAVLFACIGIALPFIALGATAGIVPCDSFVSCNLCSLGQLIQNIINFLLGLAIPLSAIGFAWSGILYFSSGGSPGQVEKAKKIFKDMFIGFIIAISAWLIIQTLISTLVTGNYFIGGKWNNLQCVSGIGLNPGERLTGTSIGQIFNPVAPTPVINYSDGQSQSCNSGDTLTTESPEDATTVCKRSDGSTYSPTSSPGLSSSGGSCSGAASAFGNQNTTQCIVNAESSGIASNYNHQYLSADGNPVVVGCFQVEMTPANGNAGNLNYPECASAAGVSGDLNCNQAFSGPGGKAPATAYSVSNSSLYQQCLKALQNVDCNTAVAKSLYNQSGYKPWETYTNGTCH